MNNLKPLIFTFVLGISGIMTSNALAFQISSQELNALSADPKSAEEFLEALTKAPEVLVVEGESASPLLNFILGDSYSQTDASKQFRSQLIKRLIKTRSQLLLSRGRDGQGRTTLMLAAGNGNYKHLFYYLFRHRAEDSLSESDLNGNTVFHFAAGAGFADAIFEIIAALDDGHVLINTQNTQGQTPLMLAVLAGSLDSVEYLLTHGAQNTINTVNLFGQTALALAVTQQNQTMIALLQEYDAQADPDVGLPAQESEESGPAMMDIQPPVMLWESPPRKLLSVLRPSARRPPPLNLEGSNRATSVAKCLFLPL